MVNKIIELSNVKDLNALVKKLSELGFLVEMTSHTVLEDYSEIAIFKAMREGRLVAYIISHYITQYYRAVSEKHDYDDDSIKKLAELKYSSEKWSIPVNPVYIIAFNNIIIETLSNYNDEYSVQDAEHLIEVYRSRNPNYKLIPRVIIAKYMELFE